MIRFLLGLRNPRIAGELAVYGFKQEDRDEGWRLIHALGKGRMAVAPVEAPEMATLLELDAWENRWFPIARATLEHRFPAVSARFFLNLSQTEGPGVVVTVRTFVDRYDELVAGDRKYGADGLKAQQLLVERGLTPALVAEAKRLLATLTQVAPAEPVLAEAEAAQLGHAERAMWSWYLEWSKIARIAIKQRSLLKELGFLVNKRGAADEDDVAPTTGSQSS